MLGLFLLAAWYGAAPLAGLLFTGSKIWLHGRPGTEQGPTSDWAERLAEEVALDATLQRGPVGFNAFVPVAGVVILDRPTFYDDTSFSRAVAAHELGHAWLYERLPWLGRLLFVGRTVQLLTGRAVLAVALTALIWGQSTPRALLELLLLAALGAGALVVFDEAVATLRGIGFLRGRLKGGWGWAVGGLVLALLTYLSRVLADAALFLALEPWFALSPQPWLSPGGAGPGWLGTAVLVLASIVLAWRVLVLLIGLWTVDGRVVGNGRQLTPWVVALFILLTWPVADTALAQGLLGGAVLLALEVPSQVAVTALALLAARLRNVLLVRRWMHWGEELMELQGLIALGRFRRSAWFRASLGLTELCWLPYVVWYWVAG